MHPEKNPQEIQQIKPSGASWIFSYIKDKLAHYGFRRYAKNIGWMFFARIATMVVSFIATAYTARNLGPTNYGELSYAISFVGIVTFFANLGIEQVLCRDLLKHPSKRNEYLGSAIALKAGASFLAFIVSSLLAFKFSPKDVSLYLIFIIGLGPLLGSFSLLSYEFQADLKSKYPSIFSVLVTIILNILKIAVIYFDQGVIYLASIIILEPVLYSIMYIFLHKKLYGNIFHFRFDGAIARSLLKDSLPLVFASAFFAIYARVDQVMIKNMLNTEAVGLYDAAVRMSEISYFIPNIIVAGLFPAIINAKRVSEDLYYKRAKKLLYLLLAISTGVALLTTLFSYHITYIIYGAGFAGSVLILKIYVWSNIGTALNLFTQQILVAENLTKNISLLLFIATLVNIGLNILYIPSHGTSGAAFASLISYTVPFIALGFIPTTRSLFKKIINS